MLTLATDTRWPVAGLKESMPNAPEQILNTHTNSMANCKKKKVNKLTFEIWETLIPQVNEKLSEKRPPY